MSRKYWINGKLTDVKKDEAILKLIDCKEFCARYSNPHDKWVDAINIGIEAIEEIQELEQLVKDMPYGGDATVRRMQDILGNEEAKRDCGNCKHYALIWGCELRECDPEPQESEVDNG